MTQLVRMAKGSDQLEVHPSTVDAHKVAGWAEVQQDETHDAGPVHDGIAADQAEPAKRRGRPRKQAE
jgi:hypothetical protein